MGMSRLEVNVRRLLSQCENMAKEDSQDWRLHKYISALDEMVSSLQSQPVKPNKETMSEYVRRVDFLKGLSETHKLSNPVEKVVATQLLSHGAVASTETVTKEIHQKTTSKYTKELRDQLFQSDKSSDEIRQRKQKTTGEDLDALFKFHHSMQEKIAEDMLSLARNLKEQSQLAGSIIKKDTETVNKSSVMADKNLSSLKVESERLQEHSRHMVFFMRLKKKNYT
ncbi:Vesicle transport protein USE1 [Gryllus bimaculatus]|nr:Vesicle transport protein USE1 [Gryllus bimaculatus]